ncbi:hypothetical protein ACIHCQ_26950 [Streptomyces sp. NPDC052236]|uniref:hypothetical protein n=1 Tax=Streptomyces sp. NPDC052236 TaxID=3365686 RepID=UPI0037D413A7
MKTPLEDPIGDTRHFELLSVSLHAEGHHDPLVALPLPGSPFALKEGAEIRVTLTFRLGKPVEGLKFVDVRERQGVVVATNEVMLGCYRPGGPYEVVLPPERLPSGHLARDTYQVKGTFVDADGHVLGYGNHCFRITKEWPEQACGV